MSERLFTLLDLLSKGKTCDCYDCLNDDKYVAQLNIAYSHVTQNVRRLTMIVNANNANGAYIDKPDKNNPGYYIRLFMLGIPHARGEGSIYILKFEKDKETLFKLRYRSNIITNNDMIETSTPQFEVIESISKYHSGKLDTSFIDHTPSDVPRITSFARQSGFSALAKRVLIMASELESIRTIHDTRLVRSLLDIIFERPFKMLSSIDIIEGKMAGISADSILRTGANKNGISDLTPSTLKGLEFYMRRYNITDFYLRFMLKKESIPVKDMVNQAAIFISKEIVGKALCGTQDVIHEID